MAKHPATKSGECNPAESEQEPRAGVPEALDPNDSSRLRDELKGQTKEHAIPPRLEDEGQSGG